MPTFIYDNDRLSRITSEAAFRDGLRYFKANRVMECIHQNEHLFALVEGATRPDYPYQVELAHDDQGNLRVVCDCDNSPEPVCKHAVAALLRYTHEAADQEADRFSSAMEAAVKDRIKRAQTEVQVKHFSGHPRFGLWLAWSITEASQPQRVYQVHLRSLQERINFCTCPDRANNQLGTCKHIEAVIYRLGKEPSSKGQDLIPPTPFVYLAWEGEETIKVQRTPHMSDDLVRLVDRYFDVSGVFTGAMPDDFFRFSDAIYGRDDIALGVDARQAVERRVTRQAHQLNAQRMRQRITQSNGQLPGLNARLYPYQIEGVAFLAANGRGLLADDMGLGKTLQAIAAANWLIEESGIRRVLIVCPASLKHQWAREIQKFTGQTTQVVQGNAEERQIQYRQDKTFFILNYELVLRDLSVINELLVPDLLILDEAQRIKNWRTQIATAVKRIHNSYVFVLTGTPLENRLEDLYSLLQVVDQHVLGPLWRYLNHYHITDEKGKVLGYRNLAELRQKIAPVMLRRNRSIVSDQLPARTTQRLDIAMTERQQELHDSALSAACLLAQIAKKRPLTPSEQNRMMAALQTARMACDAAGLVDKETEGSPKLKELRTLIQELCIEGGRKMVVFSQWRGMTLMVEALLKSMQVGCVHLNGQVPTAKRGELMDRFQNDDSVMVFISTDAGGSGLNLQAASVLVNMDIPWNPAVMEQRNARVHRLGQTNKVQIILMVAQNSYEERVLQLLGNKQQLFDHVVGNVDDPEAAEDVVGVSKKTIMALIEELNQDEPGQALLEASCGETDLNQDEALTENLPEENPKNPVAELASSNEQDQEDDARIRRGIQQIQQCFGARLQQILAQGGGLLIVLDQMDDEDEAFVEQLQLPLPIAAIDLRTRRQLQRLGAASPLVDAQEYRHDQPVTPVRKWLAQAREKVTAARLLLEQQSDTGVIELLSSALSSLLSDRANLPQVMPIDDASVWVYAEALPQQKITEQEAGVISRILSLRFASKIPASLLEQAYEDTKALVEVD